MRQPANSKASALRQILRAVRAFVALAIPDWKLDFNLKYSVWIQAFQKLFGPRQVETLVAHFHHHAAPSTVSSKVIGMNDGQLL
jgi:hypothetical protein